MAVVTVSDQSSITELPPPRTDGDGLLSQGHLLLTGLQFRGHGMFSELDRPLGSDTVEYAWLIEVHCGSLIGKITPAQLYNVFVSLEAFVFLVWIHQSSLVCLI